MTHYHLLIVAGRSIDDSTQFYKVAVGTSRQADRDYLYLVAFCANHNYYFHLWDAGTADFFERICRSLDPSHDGLSIVRQRLQVVRARDIVRAFKRCERPFVQLKGIDAKSALLAALDTNYRVFRNISR